MAGPSPVCSGPPRAGSERDSRPPGAVAVLLLLGGPSGRRVAPRCSRTRRCPPVRSCHSTRSPRLPMLLLLLLLIIMMMMRRGGGVRQDLAGAAAIRPLPMRWGA